MDIRLIDVEDMVRDYFYTTVSFDDINNFLVIGEVVLFTNARCGEIREHMG